MKKIFVVTEGQSETNFVNRVLAPYYIEKCIIIPNTVVTKTDVRHGKMYKGGLTNYKQIQNTLSKTLSQAAKNKDSYVTTMFDYYRIPSDFPGVDKSRNIENPYEKVRLIEQEIIKTENYDKNFFFPYIQLHEFEAMLFADISKLKNAYFDYDLTELEECIKTQNNPELINDGEMTAPSKRIINCIDCFDKPNVGVDVLGKIGIKKIAEKCSHFSDWIGQIEERF